MGLLILYSPKRIDYHPEFYKDKYYHVYNRSVGKDKLFFNDENYKYFLKRYSYYLNDKLLTYAFCLLPNHFHLLVKPKVDNSEILIESFRKFFISYSMQINKQQKRKGNLFQSNFKRKIIDDEGYLLQLVYYIHTNPIHHKITKDFLNYKYSSYKKIIRDQYTQLAKNELLNWFKNKESFIKYHQEIRGSAETNIYTIED